MFPLFDRWLYMLNREDKKEIDKCDANGISMEKQHCPEIGVIGEKQCS